MTTDVNDLLVEIGTEELPPKALRALSEALSAELSAELDAAGLAHGPPAPYATPRRLAVLVPGVPGVQPDRDVERRGPPLARAFDENGAPTRAASGFAKSVGVEVERLVRIRTGDGTWLGYRSTTAGAPLASLLPGMVERALARLPAPRRMRWADRDTEFVRPVHWVVLMHGARVIEAEILGVASGRITRGHRFHHPEGIALEDAGGYEAALRDKGRVVAGFEARMETIRGQVERAALTLGGRALIDPALLEENTALVEWPVAVAGHFDAEFLALPDVVLIATMQGHQRYFPVAGGDGGGDGGGDHGDGTGRGDCALMPHFIAVSNIESRDPETVRKGNERVIRPRLSDAAYFFHTDRKRSLESRLEGLRGIVFQRELGTLHAKAERVSELAARVAYAMGGAGAATAGLPAASREREVRRGTGHRPWDRPSRISDPGSDLPAEGREEEARRGEREFLNGRSLDVVAEHARRAGLLSKCDLLTEMVGEFPELQGRMGREYARADGEPGEVADAIGEVYLPRFADDAIPATPAGRAVAIADRLDTLAGCLSLGQAPTGDKDPYALRRAALGTLRIMIEGELDLALDATIEAAFEGYSGQRPEGPGAAAREPRPGDGAAAGLTAAPGTRAEVRRFMLDRLRAYFADRSIPADVFNAVLAKDPARPLDFAHRVRAVEAFRSLPEAASLAAANKRIRNILRQAEQRKIDIPGGADSSFFREDAERRLADVLDGIEPRARTMLDAGDYTGALASLASLRDDVDRFFDTVKVMDDDERVRGNRLALLARLGALFMETADVSLLQSTGE